MVHRWIQPVMLPHPSFAQFYGSIPFLRLILSCAHFSITTLGPFFPYSTHSPSAIHLFSLPYSCDPPNPVWKNAIRFPIGRGSRRNPPTTHVFLCVKSPKNPISRMSHRHCHLHFSNALEKGTTSWHVGGQACMPLNLPA